MKTTTKLILTATGTALLTLVAAFYLVTPKLSDSMFKEQYIETRELLKISRAVSEADEAEKLDSLIEKKVLKMQQIVDTYGSREIYVDELAVRTDHLLEKVLEVQEVSKR